MFIVFFFEVLFFFKLEGIVTSLGSVFFVCVIFFYNVWEWGYWEGGVFFVLVIKISVCNSNIEFFRDLLVLFKEENDKEEKKWI